MSNAGRKSKYESHVKPRLFEIKMWTRNGLMEVEMCKRLGVAVSSFNLYKNQYKELSEALKESREIADFKVEESLYKQALEGNTTAMIFWLKNRRYKEWKDKQDIEHSGTIAYEVKLPETLMVGESCEEEDNYRP